MRLTETVVNTEQIRAISQMFLLEKTWHLNISLSALMWITSEKEIVEV